MTRGSSKFISFGITSIVLMLLIFTGPAQAFILNLNIQNPKVISGETVIMEISSEPESGENLILNKFILNINGPTNILCEFNSDAEIISGCEGISIIKIDNGTSNYGYDYSYGYGGYGYSYGYGYEIGKRIYKIALDTENLNPGQYKAKINVIYNNETFTSESKFIIMTEDKSLQGCSFRGEKGVLKIDGFATSANRLSVNLPLEKAVKGEGYIYSQLGKHRFSYKFKIDGVITNSPEKAEILVSGLYKNDGNKKVEENAIITLDKLNKKIYVEGELINIENMKVKFIKNC